MLFTNGLYDSKGETLQHQRGDVKPEYLFMLPLLDDIPRSVDNIVKRAVRANAEHGRIVYNEDPEYVALGLIRLVEANYVLLYGSLSTPLLKETKGEDVGSVE